MATIAHNFEDKIRTKDVLIEERLNFNVFFLSEQTLAGLQHSGFRAPSPIQLKAIPIGKCGFDLIVKSKSGTGKTAVFSIIALELINTKKNCVQVLILAPTREVAVQIQDVLLSIGSEFKDLKVESFIGGLPVDEDIKKLNKCHIAVGAPGRVKHLLHLGALKADDIKLFVLDEADKLVNSDMKVDIEYISKKLPSARQVIASSATYSNEAITYLDKIMSNSTFIEPNTDTPMLLGLKQFVTIVKTNLNVIHQLNAKNEELIRLLSQITFSQCVIFTNYQSRTESISNMLNRKGWNSIYISAARVQKQRLKVINILKDGQCRILVTTDMIARGIDAANVDLVINYDVPSTPSLYVHRMGRAGRFGSHGVCITIAANGKELSDYQQVLGAIGGVDVSVPQLPKEGDLPNDLWNADSSFFELIQGIVDPSKFRDMKVVTNSGIDFNIHRSTSEQAKSKAESPNEKCKMNESIDSAEKSTHSDSNEQQYENEENSQTVSNAIEALLNNKKKEENLQSEMVSVDTMSILKDLATGSDTPKSESSETNLTSSKKRKRKPVNLMNDGESPNNSNQIMCKNLALLSATRLLCESYDTNETAVDLVSSLDTYLKGIKDDKPNEILESKNKENILNLIAAGEIDKLQQSPLHEELDDFGQTPGDIEDILKYSFDYAIDSGKMHWLEALGEELDENKSLTDKAPEDDPESSFNEVQEPLVESTEKRRHKTYRKKKSFKDFTQKNQKNDGAHWDQTMETYNAEKGIVDQVDPNYYQTGYWSDSEYSNIPKFTFAFDQYSDVLTEQLQTFEDVESFDAWFSQWQWQVQGVRDYVQQNIYVKEMSKYAYYKDGF